MNASVALITGAGSPQGIGFATARLLAQQGLRFAITSTTEKIEERARELAAEGADVFAFPTDLRDYARTQLLVHEVLARHSRLDILVNNAGMTQVGSPTATTSLPLADLPENEWDYGIAINLKTAFNVTKAVLPFMLTANYGRIVNVRRSSWSIVEFGFRWLAVGTETCNLKGSAGTNRRPSRKNLAGAVGVNPIFQTA